MEKKLLKIVIKIILIIIATVLSFFLINRELYQKLVQEDSLIEYLTALLLLTNSYFFLALL